MRGSSSPPDDAAEREADAVARAAPGQPARIEAAPARATPAVAWPRSGGSALDAGVRADLEARVGVDLSSTRIHHDRGTAAFAAGIGARAFTLGNDIGFAAGAYQPGSSEGHALLAHEATHVAQQRGRRASLARKDDVTAMTITAGYAKGLTDLELQEDIDAIRTYVAGLQPTDPVYDQARQNRDILQDEQVTRAVRGDGKTDESTLEARFVSFQAGVLVAAQNRLTNNQEALEQWRSYIAKQFSALDLQKQVMAQGAVDLTNIAAQHHAMRAVYDWSGEHNPAMREVDEHQAKGEWTACTGCHAAKEADEYAKQTSSLEKQFNPAWRSPAERLGGWAGMVAPGTNLDSFLGSDQSFQIVMQAVQRIHPVVAPLGDAGYRIIPDHVWSVNAGDTPEQLQATIYANIDKRAADYAELKDAIANGKVDYLQLGPVLKSLLAIAPADIQQAVQDDIDERQIEAYITIGGTIALALLSILIPPLGLAVAAIGFAQGYGQAQQGYQYALGTGANDVFTREQQDQAGELMASGVLNMGMSAAAFGAQLPGAAKWTAGAADWAASRVIVQSDIKAAQSIAERALQGPVTEAEILELQQRGLVTRAAMKWTDMRGFKILYRGQAVPTEEILSPLAREQGLEASQSMLDRLRAANVTDQEIAGFTAKYNGEPLRPYAAPPGFAGEPAGGVGIPTSRLPNVSSSFAQGGEGVIYVMRIPKNLAVEVGTEGYGAMSVVEQEYVVFHQIPGGYVMRTISPEGIPPLVYFDSPPSLVVPK